MTVDFNAIVNSHAAAQLRATGSVTLADVYRGWTIDRGRWPEPAWSATSPNYDASYEGEEDGWVSNGESANAPTRELLLAEIDAWFEDSSPA